MMATPVRINSIAFVLPIRRETLSAGEPGNEPEVDFRLAEACRVGGNSQRAGHRELAAATEANPLTAAITGLPSVR